MIESRSWELTGAEADAYAQQGFLVREAVFDAAELTAIGEACEALVARLVADRQGQRNAFGSYVFDTDAANRVIIKWEGDSEVVHGIEPFAHLSEALEQWAYDERFVAPMRSILGVSAPRLFTEKLNLKRPRVGGANPLHQDYPYWVGVADVPAELATAMLFLDEASLTNGCLHVVPGSHRQGVWQGRNDGDRFASNEIDQSRYPDLNLVPVAVASGSVVLFGPYLVHQSAPNHSDRERRALLYSYQQEGRTTQLDVLTRHLRRC